MINILILEDDEKSISELRKTIHRISPVINVMEAVNVMQAYTYAISYDISLFILDIELDRSVKNDVSGLEFACEIRNILKYKFTDIIFTTSLYDAKLYAYSRLHCYSYLEKPFDYNYLEKLVREILLKLSINKESEKTIFLKTGGVLYPVKENDIAYIETRAKKLSVITKDEVIEINNMKINEFFQKLSEEKFIRCSRFNIVNRDFIKNIDTVCRIITLKYNIGHVEIGRTMKKDFMNKLMRI